VPDTLRSHGSLLALLLAALFAAPPAAAASSVRILGPDLQYSAGAGEANTVTISVGSPIQNVAQIKDSVPIAPGEGCARGTGPDPATGNLPDPASGNPNEAFCFVTEDFAGNVLVELRDGDDSLTRTGDGETRVLDGSGNDRIMSASASDTLVNGPGNDVFRCGSDLPCRVLTGKVAGVTFYVPGLGDDRIVGTSAPDRLMGGAGNDRIVGCAGRDRLYGGAGGDVLIGGPDVDRLFGGGGPGRDTLTQGGDGGCPLPGGP
jgi:Ca2+-binding RTX toxin-like protein